MVALSDVFGRFLFLLAFVVFESKSDSISHGSSEILETTHLNSTGKFLNTISGIEGIFNWATLQSTDFRGYIIKEAVLQINDCFNLCIETQGCIGVVYATVSSSCALKSALAVPVIGNADKSTFLLAGSGSAVGVDFPGNDFSSMLADDAEDCRAQCSKVVECMAGIFTSQTKTCVLKRDLGVAELSNDATVLAPAILVGQDEFMQLIGIAPDGNLVSKPTLVGLWTPIQTSIRGLDMIQLPDLTFLVVAGDNAIWACPSLISGCTQVPNSGAVKSIDLMADKSTIIGVGMDNLLYTRNRLYGFWTLVPNSGFVFDITVLSNGELLGVGTDYRLYKKRSLSEEWVVIPRSCCVSRTAQLPDGTIAGVSTDGNLYQRKFIDSNWVSFPNSAGVGSVLAQAKFVGVGMDGGLYSKGSLSSPWTMIPTSARGLDLIQLSDLSFLVVGTDNTLWICESFSVGCSQVPNSGQVKSIGLLSNQETWIAVGMDNQLWTRAGYSGTWTLIPKSGTIVDVSVHSNGVLVGTAPDGLLYTKNNLEDNWMLYPNSCCVFGTAILSETSIIGVGYDNAMYKKSLQGSWELLLNSKAVKSVTILR